MWPVSCVRQTLQVSGPQLDPCGALDEVNGDDDSRLALLVHHNSFEPLKWTSRDAYASADCRVRPGPGLSKSECGAQGFNFLVRHRRRHTLEGHDVDNTRDLKYSQALCGRDPNKYVAGKEWQLYLGSAIFPIVNCAIERQKRFNRPANQLCGDNFLVPRRDVDRIPVGCKQGR